MHIAPAPSPRSHARLSTRHKLLVCLALLLASLGNLAQAQIFDAGRYLRNCLELERGGDYETARQSCLNALATDPNLDEAKLALGRIELAREDLAAAENNLRQAQGGTRSPEPSLLLARVFMLANRYDEAASALADARTRIASTGGRAWAGEHAFLSGDLAERQGRFGDALRNLRESVRLEPANARYLRRLASLQFDMGEAAAAQEAIEEFQARTGTPGDADMTSLLGHTLWAQGDLAGAARELEASLARRSSREVTAQAHDLRSLSLVYYGMGNHRAGGLALREATRRGNVLATFLSGNLIWLLLVLLLLALHLVGESRIGVTSSADTSDGPKLWTVGHVYGIAWTALLVGIPLAVGYGVLRYDNLLALLTPVQSSDTLAIFFVAFSVIVAVGAWRRAALNGWSPGAVLLGGGERVPMGIMLGLALLALTLAYRIYLPDWNWGRGFFLDLAHLTPAVAAALALIPLSELFFRPFAFASFEARYGAGFALLISATLSTLVLAAPTPLLLAMGLALSGSFRSSRSGGMVFAAQATLFLGLLATVAALPWARSLFL